MDIVERLRGGKSAGGYWREKEAADEIERLREEVRSWWKETEIMRSDLAIYSEQIERLREALRWAAPYVKDDPRVSAIIKAALKEGE